MTMIGEWSDRTDVAADNHAKSARRQPQSRRWATLCVLQVPKCGKRSCAVRIAGDDDAARADA
jgi:hypothetical protein